MSADSKKGVSPAAWIGLVLCFIAVFGIKVHGRTPYEHFRASGGERAALLTTRSVMISVGSVVGRFLRWTREVSNELSRTIARWAYFAHVATEERWRNLRENLDNRRFGPNMHPESGRFQEIYPREDIYRRNDCRPVPDGYGGWMYPAGCR